MPRILALSDSAEDVRHFCTAADTSLFRIRPLPAEEHTYDRFQEIYRRLKASCDLSSIDLVVAEYVESLPLLYFMRRDGYRCPALMIPHTNPYPIDLLLYFLLVAEHPHPGDRVICGSEHAKRAYEHITGIRADGICTFGIKNIYRKADQSECRTALGLSHDHTILLYTGRFMNDKGLEPLLSGYERLRREHPEVLLAMSATHIDPPYFNRLAPRMRDVVLFHRLEKERTALLYGAADLFVSGATSIFETYGKSPLEALACGVPSVVPRWDGFPYYIDDTNGGLVDVEYLTHAAGNPYEFARMREEDFVTVCRRVLGQPPSDIRAPEWATYEKTMKTLPGVVEEMAALGRTTAPPPGPHPIDIDRYPDVVRAILHHYDLRESEDLLAKASRLGLVGRGSAGEEELLRDLHHEIFGVMDAVDHRV
ncbi:glycosyltransferase family 4 protein [Streptomyces huiliensis]|uniref:glycosyltransferase family 4 protein n=1 Tax=Streptomyces huiliensis TaxID=2876027 RepID=UPI001CBE0ADA|nr:glycosyltransferase family 4 protein [Streptomyces huiliensis]MBZ4322755.1 glycosyltransferase family 4 protein [Streptomyces huiliensis]